MNGPTLGCLQEADESGTLLSHGSQRDRGVPCLARRAASNRNAFNIFSDAGTRLNEGLIMRHRRRCAASTTSGAPRPDRTAAQSFSQSSRPGCVAAGRPCACATTAGREVPSRAKPCRAVQSGAKRGASSRHPKIPGDTASSSRVCERRRTKAKTPPHPRSTARHGTRQ